MNLNALFIAAFISPAMAGFSLLMTPFALLAEKRNQGKYFQDHANRVASQPFIQEALEIVNAYPRDVTIDDVPIKEWVKIFNARKTLHHWAVLY